MDFQIRQHIEDDGLHLSLPAGAPLSSCAGLLKGLRGACRAHVGRPVVLDLDDLGPRDVCLIAVVQSFREWGAAQRIEIRLHSASEEVLAVLESISAVPDDVDQPSFFEQIGDASCALSRDVRAHLGFVGDAVFAFGMAIRHPRRVRWRDVLFYMERCGTDALPIVALICFLMGLILGFQAAVQMHRYGADIYVADLVGLSVTKELGPLMVAMICTGRAGSAFAAEIGTMKVSEEVDALVTMGLDPNCFLVVPKILALTLVMPLLTVFGDIAGILGGLFVGMTHLKLPLGAYMRETIITVLPWDVGQGLVKSAVFAVLISSVGCLRGMRTDGGAQGVGQATTSAVVSGIFLVVVFDAILTFAFVRLGLGT